jgi:hypothetical protein
VTADLPDASGAVDMEQANPPGPVEAATLAPSAEGAWTEAAGFLLLNLGNKPITDDRINVWTCKRCGEPSGSARAHKTRDCDRALIDRRKTEDKRPEPRRQNRPWNSFRPQGRSHGRRWKKVPSRKQKQNGKGTRHGSKPHDRNPGPFVPRKGDLTMLGHVCYSQVCECERETRHLHSMTTESLAPLRDEFKGRPPAMWWLSYRSLRCDDLSGGVCRLAGLTHCIYVVCRQER